MCGIIYAKNLKDNQPVNNLIKILYQNQKSRGQLGFGFVGMNSKGIDTYRAISEKEIMQYLNDNQYSEIIFHHRNPTWGFLHIPPKRYISKIIRLPLTEKSLFH